MGRRRAGSRYRAGVTTSGQRGSRAKQWLADRRGSASGAGGGDLAKRVKDLEDEVQELRRLNRRLAELMDVVDELVVPLSQRDEAKVRAYVDSHSTVL